MVWNRNRESEQAFLIAKRAARGATGLTSSRLHRWEDAGKDYSSWPGLDESARELAGTHPELGSATVTNLTRTPTPPITRGRCGMCCGMTGILCS